MAKKNEIIVKDVTIRTINVNGADYICISDIARQKNVIDPKRITFKNRQMIDFQSLADFLISQMHHFCTT